jgi:hypothetical protein
LHRLDRLFLIPPGKYSKVLRIAYKQTLKVERRRQIGRKLWEASNNTVMSSLDFILSLFILDRVSEK